MRPWRRAAGPSGRPVAVLGSGQIRVMVGSAGLGRGVRSISVSGRSELHAVLLMGALWVPSWRSPGINDVTARSGLSVQSVYTQGCLGQRFAVPGLSRQSWWAGAHFVCLPWCPGAGTWWDARAVGPVEAGAETCCCLGLTWLWAEVRGWGALGEHRLGVLAPQERQCRRSCWDPGGFCTGSWCPGLVVGGLAAWRRNNPELGPCVSCASGQRVGRERILV